MSDYISKSALLKNLWDWRLQECPVGVCDEETETYKTICECIEAVKELPTLDEKEIIRKAFERVVEKVCDLQPFLTADGQYVSLYEVVQTIKKECGINE